MEGRTGNDGNVYALSVSSRDDINREIPNAGLFDYRRTYMEGDSPVVHVSELKDDSQAEVAIPFQLKALKDELI